MSFFSALLLTRQNALEVLRSLILRIASQKRLRSPHMSQNRPRPPPASVASIQAHIHDLISDRQRGGRGDRTPTSKFQRRRERPKVTQGDQKHGASGEAVISTQFKVILVETYNVQITQTYVQAMPTKKCTSLNVASKEYTVRRHQRIRILIFHPICGGDVAAATSGLFRSPE